MTKILRALTFILVLAGLLAWGVTSMAHGPYLSKVGSKTLQFNVPKTLAHGQEASPSQLQPYKR